MRVRWGRAMRVKKGAEQTTEERVQETGEASGTDLPISGALCRCKECGQPARERGTGLSTVHLTTVTDSPTPLFLPIFTVGSAFLARNLCLCRSQTPLFYTEDCHCVGVVSRASLSKHFSSECYCSRNRLSHLACADTKAHRKSPRGSPLGDEA